jgi:hypothetical protein
VRAQDSGRSCLILWVFKQSRQPNPRRVISGELSTPLAAAVVSALTSTWPQRLHRQSHLHVKRGRTPCARQRQGFHKSFGRHLMQVGSRWVRQHGKRGNRIHHYIARTKHSYTTYIPRYPSSIIQLKSDGHGLRSTWGSRRPALGEYFKVPRPVPWLQDQGRQTGKHRVHRSPHRAYISTACIVYLLTLVNCSHPSRAGTGQPPAATSNFGVICLVGRLGTLGYLR